MPFFKTADVANLRLFYREAGERLMERIAYRNKKRDQPLQEDLIPRTTAGLAALFENYLGQLVLTLCRVATVMSPDDVHPYPGIRREKGARRLGVRIGNWLTVEAGQAPDRRIWHIDSQEAKKPRHDLCLDRLRPSQAEAAPSLEVGRYPTPGGTLGDR